MSPIQGFVRLRRHQWGRQGVFGTKVAATRAYPVRGTPSVDLAWTDPEIDAGSRDIVAAPYRGAPDLTFTEDFPSLGYNSVPLIFSAFFGGEVEPSGGGTAKTWLWEPASVVPLDELDPYTGEFGDDVLTDWYQFGDCVLESFEISGPEGLGALTATINWRMGSASSTGSTDSPVTGTVPTPGLEVDTAEVVLYLKDMGIFIADSVAGLAAGQVMDALHTFTLRGTQEIDQKRFANADQSFDVDEYGAGARTIELEATFAKTADTVGTGSESDHWMSDESVIRYVQLVFTSTVLAETPATFYSLDITIPMRYYTREEGDIGGNTTIVLMGRAFYDPDDLEGVFVAELVNTLTEAELGLSGS